MKRELCVLAFAFVLNCVVSANAAELASGALFYVAADGDNRGPGIVDLSWIIRESGKARSFGISL